MNGEDWTNLTSEPAIGYDALQKGGLIMRGSMQVNKGKKRWTYYLILYRSGKRHTYKTDHHGYKITNEGQFRTFQAVISAEIERLGDNFDPEKWKDHKPYAIKNHQDGWLNYHRTRKDRDISPATIENKAYMWRDYIVPALGEMNIDDVRAGTLMDFLAALPEHLSASTRENILGELRGFYGWLYQREEIERIPPFPKVIVDKPPVEYMPETDWVKVMAQIKGTDHFIFHFLRTYGARIGEARALHWEDVKSDTIWIHRTFTRGEVLRNRAKSGSNRILPLIPGVLPPRTALGGFVFIRKGRHYTGDGLYRIWRKAVRKAEVKYVTPSQATRHSFGCTRVEQGFSLEGIGAVLGHSDTRTTQRYAEVFTEQKAKVIEGRF